MTEGSVKKMERRRKNRKWENMKSQEGKNRNYKDQEINKKDEDKEVEAAVTA